MANILIGNNFYQGTSEACIVDLTPPTFAGIASATVQSRGQIRSTWLAATDPNTPIRYEVYIQASTSVGLFNVANIAGITSNLTFDTWTTPDGQFLVNGTTYFMGVRALDALSNRDANLVNQSVISTGVFVSADVYETEAAFALNASNQLQGTIWCLKNSILAKTGNAVMGTASYQIYDKTGNPVIGMSESGLVANAQGQYITTPVTSVLSQTLDHYVVLIVITVDGAMREGYTSLIQEAPLYDISGLFFVDDSNSFDGTFWVSANEVLKTTGLGAASYQVFDHTGTAVVGMSETGITANGSGIYTITSTPSLLADSFPGYSVRVTLVVDSVTRVEMFAVQAHENVYQPKAQFSINALNQFQGTLWLDAQGAVQTTNLGTANYTVYDKDGVAVVGLTESGIAADVNGRFKITAVSAALLTDLTHYSVKVGITAYGIEKISYKGFSLLGN